MLLDARPDRIDFRDQAYRPRLVSQPLQYPVSAEIGAFLGNYVGQGLIRDQGSEGACTGFGLAAVVNYLNWTNWLRDLKERGFDIKTDTLPNPPERVSPWMLYNVARLYDEWEGEDYSGSSCRGAMKGWHKHGVCNETYWPKYATIGNVRPDPKWHQDAAKRPLGAYYRVDALSISEMQSAIYEVGAVYCSAKVHEGWKFDGLTKAPERQKFKIAAPPGGNSQTLALPVIPISEQEAGGHAFAIVGYTNRGFIVQNSWGKAWATTWGPEKIVISNAVGGFALMTYEDWVINGQDAWVAALAAPMEVSAIAHTTPSRSRHSLLELAAQAKAQSALQRTTATGAPPWSEQKAYEHSVVMGNNGKLMRRRIDVADGKADLKATIGALLQNCTGGDVVIYAHGGLNSEQDAIRRAQVLGPWFEANNILPIFVIWRTSFMDAVTNIGQDMVSDYLMELERVEKSGILGMLDKARHKLERKFDTAFEAVAEKILGKAIWSQIKQNALTSCQHNSAENITGGMRVLADQIKKTLAGMDDPFRIHLLGHSAGAIILGHFAQDLVRFTSLGSVGLLAPACTLKFANETFRPLVEKQQKLAADKFYIVNLNRENERGDSVGPYNKSLLYLVSRAFEVPRKSPLLGLDDSWILKSELGQVENSSPTIAAHLVADPDAHLKTIFHALKDYYSISDNKELKKITEDNIQKLKGVQDIFQWRQFKARSNFHYRLHQNKNALVREIDQHKSYVPISHGSLDNDIETLNWAISHMLGNLPVPITDLSGA